MQWLIHSVRTLFQRNVFLATGALVVVAGVFVGAGVVGLGQFRSGETAPDYASESYGRELLGTLGTSPEEFIDDVVTALLPGPLPAQETESLIDELSVVLVSEDAAGFDALSENIVRRLGLAAGDATSLDEIVALLLAEIDPAGTITTVDDLLGAVAAWAAATSPNVLRILPEGATGLLAELATMSYADAAGALARATQNDTLDISLGGIVGLDPMVVPGVRWAIDDATRSISFRGETEAVIGRTPLLLSARWGNDPVPTVVAGLRTRDWRLAEAGFDGRLGDTTLPAGTFLLADRRNVVSAGEVGPAVWDFFTSDHPPLDELVIESGINLLATIDGSALPDSVRAVAGAVPQGARLGVRASLGSGVGVIDGSSRPARATLAVVMPGIDPPALPSWLAPSTDLPWALTLTTEGGNLDLGLEGGLDATLDGGVRSFVARFGVSSDGDTAAGRLVADLRAPWSEPFGLGWLTFDDLTMTVDLDDSSSSATFSAELFVAQTAATLTFDLRADGAGSSVRMLASIERLDAKAAARFLATATGASLPDELPALVIDDVLIDVRTGVDPTIAIGGEATVIGRRADVLFSVESAPGAGSGVLLGVALDSWRLADALPALDGTLLDEFEFPPTALVLSALDGSIEPADLSAPAQRFFEGIGDGRPLELAAGLSLIGSLDLRGTAIEAPLAALGFDDGRFPIRGTLPGSMLGIGSADGGDPLAGLALAVQLPGITVADGPEWFRSGSLSLVLTGRPSIGLAGSMTVLVDGEELDFNVGAEFARTSLGAELALFGELETQRPWVAPFGIEWLTVNGLALELSLDPVGTVGLGFAGDIVIGSKDLRAAIAVEISAAGVPTNLVLQIESDEGVSTEDLFAVQRVMAEGSGAPAVDTSRYPTLELRDIELRFAPRASERLGVDAGFVIAGEAYAAIAGSPAQRFAFLDVRLTDRGLFATGELSAFTLGPLSWSDVTLDLELSRDAQRFMFDGALTILGTTIDVSIDLSTDSIIMQGREALDELEVIVDGMERVLRDPAAAIGEMPQLFAAAGVPLEPWMEDLFAQMVNLVDQGQQLGEATIDVILNGGSIPLVTSPAGGNDPVCPVTSPILDDGRCYLTPAIVSADGVPAGGTAPACQFPNLLQSGGRCYTTKPTTIRTCPFGWFSISSTRCQNLTGTKTTAKTVTNIPGIPSGGVAKSCGLLATFSGRCYVVTPGEVTPAVPDGGADLVCELFSPFEEGGRCYTVTPSQAERGLGVQGLCRVYAEVECNLEDLVDGALLDAVVERLVTRLSDW
jgi:hypothetical protein